MGWLLAALAALYVVSKDGGLSTLVGVGSSAGNTGNVAPTGYAVPGTANGNQGTFQTVQTANLALNAVPVVGPALSAVASALTKAFAAASAKRAKLATDENSAVALAVPGWDQNITQMANAYNNGSINASQALAIIAAAWANYWAEVSPHIQPGRNACKSGTVVQDKKGPSFCQGGYGAACCVGYDSIDNSNINMQNALKQTENTGKAASAIIVPVFASKYGGINRASYTVTFIRPSGLFA
jgi:hypothetical protein